MVAVIERCDSCQYWTKVEPDDIAGVCHRFPPTLLQDPELRKICGNGDLILGKAWWPETMPDDWCGEWKIK